MANDIIPAFNAADANRDIVLEPLFPAEETADPSFAPTQPPPVDPKHPSKQWDTVVEAWRNPGYGSSASSDFVTDMVSLMGWDFSQSSPNPDDRKEPLNAAPPQNTGFI